MSDNSISANRPGREPDYNPDYSPGEIAAMEAEALRAKVAVPRPESLHSPANDLNAVGRELIAVYVAVRDLINDADANASGQELGKLFDTSVMIERSIARLSAAQRDISEVIELLPSIRLRLNELGMSS